MGVGGGGGGTIRIMIDKVNNNKLSAYFVKVQCRYI